MLIYVKATLFLWAEAVDTACYTQNRSITRLRHGKTPYELLDDKLLNISFFHVFGALCYPTNDSENLGKLQPKADIGIFIGYNQRQILVQLKADIGIFRRRESILKSLCSGYKIRGYKDFSRVCCSYEHGRLPNGCEDYVSK
ncbi:retrovirus-related pol polyprotein from transposon TNT 1-94, partial [Tanacetum coccineum]